MKKFLILMAIIASLGFTYKANAAAYYIGEGSVIDGKTVKLASGSITNVIDDTYLKNVANIIPWGSVARYSGNKVYFTNDVWAALSEAVNGDTIVINGHFEEPYITMLEDGSHTNNDMTSATDGLTLIGTENSYIHVNVDGPIDNDYKYMALNLASVNNLYLKNFNVIVDYHTDDGNRIYNVWFNNCHNLKVEDCTFQGVVYGENNTFKNFVATEGQTNVVVKNCDILSVDIPKNNIIYHTAGHGGEPILFKNCHFIAADGKNSGYCIGTTYFEGCYGTRISLRFLPVSYCYMKGAIIGDATERENVENIVLPPTKTSVTIYDREHTGVGIYHINPGYNFVSNVCYSNFSEIPTDRDYDIYVSHSDYTYPGFKRFNGINDITLNYIGKDYPSVVDYAQWVFEFIGMSNVNINVKGLRFYTISDYRYFTLGMQSCTNSTVTASDCIFDFRSVTSQSFSVGGMYSTCLGCSSYVENSDILINHTVGWNAYSPTYNNVRVYLDDYDHYIGTLYNINGVNKLIYEDDYATKSYVDNATNDILTFANDTYLKKAGGVASNLMVTNLAVEHVTSTSTFDKTVYSSEGIVVRQQVKTDGSTARGLRIFPYYPSGNEEIFMYFTPDGTTGNGIPNIVLENQAGFAYISYDNDENFNLDAGAAATIHLKNDVKAEKNIDILGNVTIPNDKTLTLGASSEVWNSADDKFSLSFSGKKALSIEPFNYTYIFGDIDVGREGNTVVIKSNDNEIDLNSGTVYLGNDANKLTASSGHLTLPSDAASDMHATTLRQVELMTNACLQTADKTEIAGNIGYVYSPDSSCTNLYITDNLYNIDSIILTNKTTQGSWRIYVDDNTNLNFQINIGGSWVTKQQFTE